MASIDVIEVLLPVRGSTNARARAALTVAKRDDEVVSVSVIIRYFDGCPSWQTARANLEVAARRVGVEVDVSLERVETMRDAERLGFVGSPTLLLDGIDPFAAPHTRAALACRVYATSAGLAGSPTAEQLGIALTPSPAGDE